MNFDLFNDKKIIINIKNNDFIIRIDNFKSVLEYDDKHIIIDDYIFNGLNFIISSIEGDSIEIKGQIEEIKFKKANI